jgi:MFS family permease
LWSGQEGKFFVFSALRHRNFRLYLGGQFVSLLGTWMQQLAISWLVYRLTKSALWLGVATFAGQIPTACLGLFAGVFVDRINRQRLLMWTQGLSAIQALVLAFLTLYGKINYTEIIILSILLGVINAVDTPARQTFVVQMIDDKKDLPNAIALNSSVMNGTRLLGPVIAGIFIAAFGEGICFLVNAVSYIAVLFALHAMKLKKLSILNPSESMRNSLRVGLRAAFGSAPIGSLLILLSLLSLIGAPFITLFPALADRVLKGDAHTLGLLSGATGLGAFTGAVLLATRKSVLKFGRMIGASAVVFAICIFLLASGNRLPIALPLLYLAGCGMMLQMASSNILIQTLVDDDKRGRVMSLFTLSLMGVSPFGSLLVGSLAESWGIPFTLRLCGGLYLIAALWFVRKLPALSRTAEPIYTQLGIWIPPSPGVATSSGAKPFVF